MLTDEDMEQLPLPSKHTIDVHAFLDSHAILELMYDTPYYVGVGEKDPRSRTCCSIARCSSPGPSR